jgi:hypothetical protein
MNYRSLPCFCLSSKHVMPEHLPFLRIVWRLFTGHSTGEFPSRWVSDFVADRVIDELGNEITFDRVVYIVKIRNAVEESFEKTISSLQNNWSLIGPKTKTELIEAIKGFQLTDRFQSVPLNLTSEEREFLSVRWDISDILYFETKQKAIEECRTRGLDLENYRLDLSDRTFPSIVSNCREIIIGLLKSKIQTDLAVVGIAAPKSPAKYLTMIADRVNSEFLDFLDHFRKPIRDLMAFLKGLSKDQSQWTVLDDLNVTEVTENSIKEFKQDFEVLKSKIPKLQPGTEIYNRVRELIGTRNVTMIGEVMRDKYIAGQVGAMGPNAQAHDINFNQLWNQLQPSIDLAELADELSRLRQEMKKQAVAPEEDIAVSDVAKAEQAAKAGDGSKVMQHLKSAGGWALNVGSKVGTDLAVKMIKASLGM